MLKSVAKQRFHSLGDYNLWVGLISCVMASALLLDLLAWPFNGPKPTQTNILLAHFALAITGFVMMIWQH